MELVETESGEFFGRSIFWTGELVPVWEGKREYTRLYDMTW